MAVRSTLFAAATRLGWLLALILAGWAAPASACDVPTSTATNVGSFSPAAIKANAPYARVSSGFGCTGFTVLTLLSTNYLKATIASGTVLKLTSAASPADTVTYRLFGDAGASVELKPGIDAFYMKGSTINVLNLLGDGTIDVPLFFKLASSGYVAPGTYTGSFSVRWDWNFCNGIAALGACVGTTDSGAKTETVAVTLVVAARSPTVSVAFGPITWDAVNGTSRPKAIPGSKRRLAVTIANPDIVPAEPSAIVLTVATPVRMAVALDGDGTGGGGVFQATDGATPSGLSFAYVGPASSTDQVDFSTDGGTTWTYVPVAGDAASQAGVSAIRLRPQGSMAAASSYTITFPYSVR